ncbi:MAG: D-alanyl-D-alanine carboxypeptidase, partial [Oligoflexales bacterium]|nr:D-alanyl-D-alanine carboxypeptidase [Oligoflexales bacterium]
IKGPHAQKLITLDGYPLTKAIEGLNIYSNNYIADMLVKSLGAASQGNRPGSGSLASGLKVIESFLQDKIGMRQSFVLKNGSGLDTGNRLSAKQIAQVLYYMANSLEIFPEFLASLPASGLTGTLEKRFDDLPNLKNGAVRAKTGTLTSPITVASLAGYVKHNKQGLLAFVIVSNGNESKSQPSLVALRQQHERIIASYLR